MQRSVLCRSRRELSNAYLIAKFRFDTAENEPSKVGQLRDAPPAPLGMVSAGRWPSISRAGLETAEGRSVEVVRGPRGDRRDGGARDGGGLHCMFF